MSSALERSKANLRANFPNLYDGLANYYHHPMSIVEDINNNNPLHKISSTLGGMVNSELGGPTPQWMLDGSQPATPTNIRVSNPVSPVAPTGVATPTINPLTGEASTEYPAFNGVGDYGYDDLTPLDDYAVEAPRAVKTTKVAKRSKPKRKTAVSSSTPSKRGTRSKPKKRTVYIKAATVDPFNIFGNKNGYNPLSSADREAYIAKAKADVRANDRSYPNRKGAYGYDPSVDISMF